MVFRGILIAGVAIVTLVLLERPSHAVDFERLLNKTKVQTLFRPSVGAALACRSTPSLCDRRKLEAGFGVGSVVERAEGWSDTLETLPAHCNAGPDVIKSLEMHERPLSAEIAQLNLSLNAIFRFFGLATIDRDIQADVVFHDLKLQIGGEPPADFVSKVLTGCSEKLSLPEVVTEVLIGQIGIRVDNSDVRALTKELNERRFNLQESKDGKSIFLSDRKYLLGFSSAKAQ